jgi:hypothetical protein
MAATESFDAGIARQIGHYADAMRVPAGHDQILVSDRCGGVIGVGEVAVERGLRDAGLGADLSVLAPWPFSRRA